MSLRTRNLKNLGSRTFDALIVGGGINGAVSAAALCAQGLEVALIDRGDFAGVTSQESSNLAWGGIKYLETGELGLVRDLCRSRNRLLATYPASIREIRFFTTVEPKFRHHRATLYLGTWLYWLIGNCYTLSPRWLDTRTIAREVPEIDTEVGPGGFEYSDAHLVDNDARFVFGFIRAAIDRGSIVANYVESLGSQRDAGGQWQTRVRDVRSGRVFAVNSRLLINACGPTVEALNEMNGLRTRHRHIFSKGVHLIVDRIGDSTRVLTFFADDGRLFFVIPLGSKSCIGTTDTRVTDLPATVSSEDRRFILDNINRRLKLVKPLTERDIIAERCGVRPLVVDRGHSILNEADWTALSRKHAVEVDAAAQHISIFGGKITDCLNIGSEVIAAAQALGSLPRGKTNTWFGEPPEHERNAFLARARGMRLDDTAPQQPHEPASIRLWRRYGQGASTILDSIERDSKTSDAVIAGTEFSRAELEYIANQEMVVTLADFLRRRTDIALTTRPEQIASLPGLLEACRILFGTDARARFDEWRYQQSAVSAQSQAMNGTRPMHG